MWKEVRTGIFKGDSKGHLALLWGSTYQDRQKILNMNVCFMGGLLWPCFVQTSKRISALPYAVISFFFSHSDIYTSDILIYFLFFQILQYVLQGLFHPARKVRDVYWKIYNNLYIGAQDALVAGYPRIMNMGNNIYGRDELDMVL